MPPHAGHAAAGRRPMGVSVSQDIDGMPVARWVIGGTHGMSTSLAETIRLTGPVGVMGPVPGAGETDQPEG